MKTNLSYTGDKKNCKPYYTGGANEKKYLVFHSGHIDFNHQFTNYL